MANSFPPAGGGSRPGSYHRRNVDPFAAIRRNHRIKVPQVRLISPEGKQLGIIDTAKAINLALENGLDLVEVAPNATPPVCRIMDFGKYVYEESKKTSHVKSTASRIKEIEFTARIEQHEVERPVLAGQLLNDRIEHGGPHMGRHVRCNRRQRGEQLRRLRSGIQGLPLVGDGCRGLGRQCAGLGRRAPAPGLGQRGVPKRRESERACAQGRQCGDDEEGEEP